MKYLALLTILLPAFASAGTLDLKQDFGGLDLAVTMSSANDPDSIKIANKTTKLVTCTGNFTGADAGVPKTVTINPGKSATMPVPGSYTDMPRSADLKCAERPAKK